MLKQLADIAKTRLKFDFPYDTDVWVNDMNMMMENYHKHTTWSNLVQIDSATSIQEFINHSDRYGRRLYFSTEHGYPGEWLYCYDVCKQTQDEKYRNKIGINNPVRFRYGAEVYWVKDRLAEHTEEFTDKHNEIHTRNVRDNTNCHMVIIARNYNAIRKCNYIISCAHDDGFYYKPRIDLDLLFTLNSDDVYITSACVAGWKYSDAEDIWLKIWEHFGDSFFLEYQTHNTEQQKKINSKIFELSQKYGIQTIIGLDTHYVNEEDSQKRDNLLKRKGLHYEDEDGWYMDDPDGNEVFRRMMEQGVIPEGEVLYAMMNTHVFTNRCEDIEYDTEFKIPILDKYKHLTYEQRCDELKKILQHEYSKEDDKHKSKEREDAVAYECGEYCDSGCADYPLDNYNLVSLAINKYGGQLTTTSRGSAASYYTNKLMHFTTMDRFEAEVPIFPERFITKDRILASHQMPDLDLNCSSQEPFVKAARELFGEHGCYPLLAVGKLGEKSGFKLYADIQGIEPSLANDITSEIDKYNEALKNVDDDEDYKNIHIEDYITDSDHLRIFYDSKPYQGIIEIAKVHACGFALFNGNVRQQDVVGYGDIRYEIGLIRCHSESTGKSTIVANVEGGLLDSYGYVKDDFLIVDVVGIIHKLYQSINMNVPTVTELRKMVTDDQQTWNLYANGITCCLNQCEKVGTTKRAMQYKPKNIKELAAFIAAIRPGFKSHLNQFLAREPYTSGETAIDNLLKDSFNFMLYQESVMLVYSYLGIPMKESYDTIKKISKKKLVGEALQHVEDNLRNHWLNNIGNLDNFEPVYKVIKDSQRYAFNSPHALAMANDSLYEAWMKGHHTSKFYEVTLNHYQDKNDKNKVAELEHEAMKFYGYQIGSYGYGQDNTKFTIDDEKKIIYPSLSSVKGIGDKAVADIFEIYQKGYSDFIDVYLAIKGTKVNGTVFRNLIKIGYFKEFGSIKKLLETVDMIDNWRTGANVRKTISKSEISNLGLDGIDLRKYASDISEKTGKISDKQFKIFDWKGLMKALADKIPNEEFSLHEIIQFQREILGYIEYSNPSFDKRLVVVTKLNTSYSPKFEAFCLNNRQVSELKIHKRKNPRDNRIKTSWADLPLKDGDIVYMKNCKKEPKRRKNTDGEWEDIPGMFDWWLNDYSISNL